MATADDMELWCTTQGLGIECDDVEIKEFPANTPVQEEGVVVLPAGSHSHSLKSVPVAEQGSKAAREGLQSPPKATACRWCGEAKHMHVTWPARSNYFQCRREVAPFVGCTYDAMTACDWLREQGIFMDSGDL